MAHTPLLPLLAAFVLAGCASHYRLGVQLPPGGSASLRVTGTAPTLRIDNAGPGDLEVQVTDAAGTSDTTNLGPGCLARTLRGGASIVLVATRATTTAVLQVQGCDGAELLHPAPPPPTGPR